ncbi:hypothetical protein EB796_003572 [Bugula neritina]|uniref:Caspase family p10 domain-containing protein n=1 Tax=Bugula neritina TaxID=10212 RepID=A0A7J7KHH6_BUGNE|nr:hypothetical protein EB796_003572 [Bugula neritina]
MLMEPLRALAHIPKIIIVQAHQVDAQPSRYLLDEQKRMQVAQPMDGGSEYFYDHIPPALNPLRRHSDAIFVNSVLRVDLPSTHAHTLPLGSEFIEALCDVLRYDGRKLEIMKLLARATRMMSYGPHTPVEYCHPNKDLRYPSVFSVLTKDFYFY